MSSLKVKGVDGYNGMPATMLLSMADGTVETLTHFQVTRGYPFPGEVGYEVLERTARQMVRQCSSPWVREAFELSLERSPRTGGFLGMGRWVHCPPMPYLTMAMIAAEMARTAIGSPTIGSADAGLVLGDAARLMKAVQEGMLASAEHAG